MALAYTAPTWVNGSGTGISASQLQALSDCMEGLVQGSDKAITNIVINGQTITLTFADGSQETGTASGLKGISSIAKTGTSGNVDTYTITYTDGSTSTFTVTNGADCSFYIVTAGIKSTDDPYGNIEYYIGGDFYKNGVLYNQSAFYKVTLVDETEYPPTSYLIDGSSGTFTNGHYSTGSIGGIPSGATITTQIFTDSTMATLLGEVKVLIGLQGSEGEQGPQGPAGDDGVSPEVTITTITGGHRVNIKDATHPQGQDFDVMDGATQDISGKADKVTNATNGNFAGLDSNGNLTDSGKKESDFLPSNTPIPDAVTANPQGTATGTLTKLGIGSDIYDIQGDGITKTITVYSAAVDTVSFTDMIGSKTVTTDSSGVGTVSIKYIPGQIITFTSSVAKNPENLSEDYKKTIQILEDDTEVYVMPNNVLYWYGYQSSNCEDILTANGWSRTGVSFGVPTHNTNNISVASGSSSLTGIGNKNAIANYTKAHAIFKGNTLISSNYGALAGTATKAISDLSVISLVPTDALTHVELNSTLSYISMFCMAGRTGTIYALWYENGDDGNYDKADADLIAPVQKSLTAKKAYAAGEQFVYNQTLYRVAQAIAQGAQITIGTNAILAGCVTEQIKNISVNYSTAEHVVGTWTTGETLYEITLTKTEPNSTEHYIDVTSLNIQNVVYIDAVRIDSSGNVWPANANRGNNPWGDYQYVGASKKITFYKSGGTAWQGALLVCTIRYTKNS